MCATDCMGSDVDGGVVEDGSGGGGYGSSHNN